MPELRMAADEVPGERVFIGLGANLGAAAQTIEQAVRDVAALAGVQWLATSALYASAPVDAGGPEYTNAAIEVRSTLEPEALLAALHTIEAEHGRQRPYRNAPRTLDLDLLMFGQRVVDTPGLQLPHPRLHQRAFVLRPLLDLAPALCHPTLGPLSVFLQQVQDQPIRLLLKPD